MKTRDKRIIVVGSANMDMVVTVGSFPRPGETILGKGFHMSPGGKGANQAVAAAKIGGNVCFVGKMGEDIFRDKLVRGMKSDGVFMDDLLVDKDAPTGTALITVSSTGQNEIIVVSGSNMKLRPADIERKKSLFASASVTLLQLETPIDTVTKAAQIARKHRHIVILNPAPARGLPENLLRLVDILTPNETETEILTGICVRDDRSAEKAAGKLLAMGVGNVIITMGEKGCLLVAGKRKRRFPALKVKAIDTTAAGDAFNGALAYSLASGDEIQNAIEFAGQVAAYSVTKSGAQRSMPTMKDLKKFLRYMK